MQNLENILNEYIQSDIEKRLHMFLYYRTLRHRFTLIDQGEIKNNFAMSSSWKNLSRSIFLPFAFF